MNVCVVCIIISYNKFWKINCLIKEMVIFEVVLEGVKVFVSTLWELQEMRFAAILDDVVSMAITIVVASVSCFLATTTTTEHNIL
uniref:Uncharacterized protein n=1 Tax=Cannabis sativa TaxID=3483 RepID=A0A803R2Q1_CANSA